MCRAAGTCHNDKCTEKLFDIHCDVPFQRLTRDTETGAAAAVAAIGDCVCWRVERSRQNDSRDGCKHEFFHDIFLSEPGLWLKAREVSNEGFTFVKKIRKCTSV